MNTEYMNKKMHEIVNIDGVRNILAWEIEVYVLKPGL